MAEDHASGHDVPGLHRLKDRYKQVSMLDEHCRAVISDLTAALAATMGAVPDGRQTGYRIAEHQTPARASAGQSERRLEARVFCRWKCGNGMQPVRGLWDCLVAYQIPLFDRQAKAGWGYIDLLGYASATQTPIIVELKDAGSPETPLRAMLEGVAYAIAVRKLWTDIGRSIHSAFPDLPVKALTETDEVGVVVLAPEAYWLQWTERSNEPEYRLRRRYIQAAGAAFAELVESLRAAGYPIAFGELALSNGMTVEDARVIGDFPPGKTVPKGREHHSA